MPFNARTWTMAISAMVLFYGTQAQEPKESSTQLLDSARRYMFTDYEKADRLLNAAETQIEKTNEDNVALLVKINQVRILSSLFAANLQKCKQYIDKNTALISRYKEVFGLDYKTLKAENEKTLGQYYINIDDYPNAIAVLTSCLKGLKSEPTSFQNCRNIWVIHGDLATILERKGEFDAAINQNMAGIPYYGCLRRYESGPGYIYLTYRNIGKVYLAKKEYAMARKYFDIALDSMQALVTIPPSYGQAAIVMNETLAAYYRAIGKPDSSLIAFQNAEQYLRYNQPFTGRVYMGLGEAYAAVGKNSQARKYYGLAERFFQKTDVTKSTELAKAHFSLGKLYAGEGKYNEALQSFQRSMANLVKDFEPDESGDDPPLKNVLSKKILFSVLQQKAGLMWGLYNQNGDPSWLEKARKTNLTAIALLDSTANEISLNTDKVILAEQSFSVFEKGIQISASLYHRTRHDDLFEECFSLADKSKGRLLLENLRFVNRYAGVDPALIDEEKAIKSELLQTEQALYKGELKRKSTEELLPVRERYANLKQDYSSWMETMKKKAPYYYRLRFDHETISSNSLQHEVLQKGEALLEFFVGDSTLTLFGFTQNKKYLGQQNLPSDFHEKVKLLRDYLMSGDEEKSAEPFQMASAWLYDLLIKDCLSQLGGDITSLTVIPDGVLGYVPFEILHNNERPSGQYLINDYSIHYAYSASYLSEQFQKKSTGSRSFFAGFVSAGNENPGSDASLGFLRGAQAEVASIEKLLGGGSSVYDPATKRDFLQKAGSYKVLHLAMHSLVNDQNPMLSELVFSDDPTDSSKDNRLTAIELYNMQLNADMAVLSACNTGSGQIHRGEGIMSMSRAFAFAGVPSAVISLWEVPDKATSRIMVNYYRFLKEGNTKDRALQFAKQTFVKDYPQMADPYYWSGFILTGSNEALEFPTPVWWFWLAAVVVLLSAFVMMAGKGIHKKILSRFFPGQSTH